MLRYCERRPDPRLAGVVRCFWSLEGEDAEAALEHVLPDGHPELVVHLGQPFRRMHRDGPVELQPPAFLVGEIATPFLLQPPRRASVLGVRLVPGGAAALVGGSAAAWTGRTLPLEALWGRRGRALHERLAEAAGFEARVAVATDWILAACGGKRPDPRVHAALAVLARGGGVDAAAGAAGVGGRHLERLFRAHVGLGPKRMQRLGRFRCAVRRLGAGPGLDLATLALRCGYSDQAHLTREFRLFAATTPAAFAATRVAGPFEDSPLVGFLQDGETVLR